MPTGQSSRYQDQTKLVKRCRDLWLLLLPYDFLCMWFHYTFDRDSDDYSARTLWSIARSICDVRRQYFWTWDEVKSRQGEMLSEGQESVTALNIRIDFRF
jgi:hypothetical protein